jgi:hypothetical protein
MLPKIAQPRTEVRDLAEREADPSADDAEISGYRRTQPPSRRPGVLQS